MEFRQLTYFLAAAQTENFRKAADICLVAQSALSRQIAALEEELGVELFRRIERRVYLTPAGKEFAAFARNALEQLQKGQQAMVDLEAGERGTIFIGCVEALATSYLPTTFARFHRAHPNVRLHVRVGGADDIIRLLEQGELDFALLFDPPRHSELLAVHELFRQPIQLIVAASHPLAYSSGPLLLDQVLTEPQVLLGEGYGLRRITEAIFNQRHLSLQPVVEVNSIESMKEFVKQGVGVSFMPEALLRPRQLEEGLVVLPVADLTEEYAFGMVYRRFGAISMVARGMIEAITSTGKELSLK
ncbi:MAG TPA: LysR family transcriptional regulator [Chloroflexia bacterium]|nr:LysR family transcriptional regulator [Chloroflexia bacterium]